MQTKSSILRKVKNGLSLAELSEALRNDFEIAQEAVRQNWREMNFLSENLQKKLYHIANHYFSIEVAMKPEVFKEASKLERRWFNVKASAKMSYF